VGDLLSSPPGELRHPGDPLPGVCKRWCSGREMRPGHGAGCWHRPETQQLNRYLWQALENSCHGASGTNLRAAQPPGRSWLKIQDNEGLAAKHLSKALTLRGLGSGASRGMGTSAGAGRRPPGPPAPRVLRWALPSQRGGFFVTAPGTGWPPGQCGRGAAGRVGGWSPP